VSKNIVLRKVIGPRKDDVTGDWRKLHKMDFNNFYSTADIKVI
jgi:hypothetical protein